MNTTTPKINLPRIITAGKSVKAIYLPATNSRGSRIKVTSICLDKPKSLIVPYSYSNDAYDTAFLAYVEKYGEPEGFTLFESVVKTITDKGYNYTILFNRQN